MKLIVGLGNPGERYLSTRHNVGFIVVDALVDKLIKLQFPISSWQKSKNERTLWCKMKIKGQEIEFIKPHTFMNDSGISVGYEYKKHSLNIDDIYVIHDDLDINLGDYKVQKGKGPKVHNGVESVEKHLKSKDFWRVRVGIENRETSGDIRLPKGEDYVLQNFTNEEKVVLDSVIEKVIEELISKL